MRLHLFVIALFAFGFSSKLSAGSDEHLSNSDVQILLKTAHFGMEGYGPGPNVTEGEAALRRILKKDDAIRFLIPVFDHGTPEGKCYALIGFHLLSPAYFESSSKRIAPWNDSKIRAVAGCIIGDAKVRDVVDAIREGRYDDGALGKKVANPQ